MSQDQLQPTQEFFETTHLLSDEAAIASYIKIPEDPNNCPQVILWFAPARSGTTAAGMMMASHPQIDRSYFQPFKNIIRHQQGFSLATSELAGDQLVFLKDTNGPLFDQELFDPVSILTKAGVPPQKITAIFSLRNPLNSYASLIQFTDRMQVDYYAQMQQNILDLYRKYANSDIVTTPFSYDSLAVADPLTVMKTLLYTAELNLGDDLRAEFDFDALRQRMVWGEACDPTYFWQVIFPTLKKGRFSYVNGSKGPLNLPAETSAQLIASCQTGFEAFHQQSLSNLGLMQPQRA